jgi:predicted permease
MLAALGSLGREGLTALPRSLWQGGRSLIGSPGLTSAIVLTVGVGIGGCTLVFAVVDTLFIRPLPYPDPDRLVWIYTDAPPNRWPFSVVDLQALQEQQSSFEELAAFTQNSRTLVSADAADLVRTVEGSPGFFELLGVEPLSGRTPSASEGDAQAPPTALVTQGFAARHLGSVRADGADALSTSIELDGEVHAVIGVLPSGFGPVGRQAEIFPTLRLQPAERKGPFFLTVLGRLGDEAEPDRAAQELAAINARLFPLWVDSYQDDRASWGMVPLAGSLREDAGRLLAVLMGAVAMLLLVAVANAANLLLARVSARRLELSVRRALGASRARVAVHLLAESLLLAAGGVLVGLALAQGGLRVLPTLGSAYIPRLAEVELGGTTLTFSLVLAAGCGVLFGLVPILQGIGTSDVAAGLRAGGRTSTGTVREHRFQRALVAGQLAVVVPLLAGAALLLTSFVNLQGTDPGFEPEQLVTMRVTPSQSAFPDPETRGQFWDAVLDRVSAHHQVTGVGVANGRPPVEPPYVNNFDLEDRPTPPGQSQPGVPWILAEPGFFETLGVPLLAGRMFEESDRAYAPEVAIVDAAWARRFFPGEEAVGRRFRHGGCTECDWTTVVGVVGDVPYGGLGEEGAGAVYQPDPLRFSSAPFLFVRSRGEPEELVAAVRGEILAVDPTTPVTQVETGGSLLRGSLTRPRHLMLLLTTSSAVALILAVVGLYGITAYSVERRRGDLAVRLALGGTPREVLTMVVGQGVGVAAAGLALGVLGAVTLTRILGSLLYGVSPRDPVVLLVVAGLVLSVSAVACAVPARRVVSLDPASTLREEG